MNNICGFTLYEKYKVCKRFGFDIKFLKSAKIIEFCFSIIYVQVGLQLCNYLIGLRCKYERKVLSCN